MQWFWVPHFLPHFRLELPHIPLAGTNHLRLEARVLNAKSRVAHSDFGLQHPCPDDSNWILILDLET